MSQKTGICRLLGRKGISSSHKGPCPGSQASHQTLFQQMDPQGLWVCGSWETALLGVLLTRINLHSVPG